MRDRHSYTIPEEASESERDAVCRAVLRAVWSELAWIDIDLVPLPDDVEMDAAVEVLRPYRTNSLLSRRLADTAHVVPGRDDVALDAVLQISGKTIGATGLAASDSRMIYDANDCATSCVFELTDNQRDEIKQILRDQSLPEDLLVPWGS